MGDHRVVRFLQLLTSRGFVHEIPASVNGLQKKLFRFGTQGTLLRKNIIRQWWDAIVLQQPNAFCVECPPLMSGNSACTGDLSKTSEAAFSNCSMSMQADTVFRASLTSDCLSAYLSGLELANGQLPVSVASVSQCYNVQQPDSEENNGLLKNGVWQTSFVFQHYSPPVNVAQTFDFLLQTRLQWWKQFTSNPSKFSSSAVTGNDKETTIQTAISYTFPWGTEPVEIISNHRDVLLHTMESKTGISHQGVYHKKSFHPYLIECHTSLEKCMAVFLTDAFRERQQKKQISSQKVKDTKIVLQLHPLMCPYQVALSVTGTRSQQVCYLAEHIAKDLRGGGIFVLNLPGNSGSMDFQYRRNDELGVLYTVVLSDQTLDNGVINIRHRDTGLKQQQHVSTLQAVLLKNLYETSQDRVF